MKNCINFHSCKRKIYVSLYYKYEVTVTIAETTGEAIISSPIVVFV